MSANELRTLLFEDDIIDVVATPDGRDGVVVKRICDNLEASFPAQFRKLKNNPLSGVVMMAIPDANGRLQETLVIPCNRVAWWLSTINAKKVKSSLSPKLLRYQHALADALDAFVRGKTSEEVITAAPVVSKPKTKIQMLLETVQEMAALEEKQNELGRQLVEVKVQSEKAADKAEKAIEEVKEKTDKTDLTVQSLVEHRGRIMGIPGLANRGFKVPDNMQSQVGKELCEIARGRGDEPRSTNHKTPNGKFEVATYFPEVLDEWVKLNGDHRSSWKTNR